MTNRKTLSGNMVIAIVTKDVLEHPRFVATHEAFNEKSAVDFINEQAGRWVRNYNYHPDGFDKELPQSFWEGEEFEFFTDLTSCELIITAGEGDCIFLAAIDEASLDGDSAFYAAPRNLRLEQ